MALHDFSIRARLLALTGLGILTAAILIGMGLYDLRVLNQDVKRLAERNIPLTVSTAEIRRDILRNWINTLYLTHITDPVQAAEIDADMEKNSVHITEQFAYLEKTLQTPEEKRLLELALQARKDYTAARKQYVEMFKHGETETANASLMSTVRPRLDAYIATLNAMNAYRAAEVAATVQRTEADISRSRLLYLVFGLLSLTGSVLLSWALIGSITKPLDWAISIAGKIADGNLKNNLQPRPDSRDEITRLLNALAAMQAQLRGIIDTIQHNSAELVQSAREFSTSASEVAHGSQVQSEAASATAASVEEMTQSIRQLSEHADQTRGIVNHSTELSLQNSQAIRQTVSEMKEISSAVADFSVQITSLDQQSQEISAILNVIKALAEQTNLLALNAAIEAARAGEQGRGFAVVADEVRKLAERTTQATQEISNTIATIQGGTAQTVQSIQGAVSRVERGVGFAEHAGSSAQKLHQEAEQANHVVTDISDALKEQSQASLQIAQGVEQIAQMTERNSVTVTQMEKGAERLKQLAATLDQSTHSFKL